MRTYLRLGCLFLFFAGGPLCFSANYYFSARLGVDSRSIREAQHPDSPWRSLVKASEIARQCLPGDTIFLRRGDLFYGSLRLDRGGTAAAPVVISAYGHGPDPVISGFRQVSTWTDVGGGRYQSDPLPSGTTVNIVLIDGIYYPMGRFPNRDAGNGGYLALQQASHQSLNSHALQGIADFSGGELVVKSSNWTLERRVVNTQNDSLLSWSVPLDYLPGPGNGFFFQHHPNTLDEYGEWHYDERSKTLMVYFGEEPPDIFPEVQLSAVEVLIMPGADHLTIEHLTLEGANSFGIFYADEMKHIHHLQIKDCRFRYSGIDAVHLVGVAHFSMTHSTLLNSNNCALKLPGYDPHTKLLHNTIVNTGMYPGMGGSADGNYTALYSVNEGMTAAFNSILNSGYTGIRFAHSNVEVKNNLIQNFCLILDDGAGIYTYDSEAKTTGIFDRRITGNIVLGGKGATEGTSGIEPAAHGIYIDDHSSGIEINNNTVAGCSGNGIFIHNARELKISHNTIFDNDIQWAIVRDDPDFFIHGIGGEDNIFYCKEAAQLAGYFLSRQNDFHQMGRLNGNVYSGPEKDLMVYSAYTAASGKQIRKWIAPQEWQDSFLLEHGIRTVVALFSREQVPASANNQISNGSFEDEGAGSWCHSPEAECSTQWLPEHALGRGVLALSTTGAAFLGLNAGAVEAGQSYRLRFKAVAGSPAVISVFLQQSDWPWLRRSRRRAVRLTTETAVYEVDLAIPVSESFSSLQFGVEDRGLSYWFDDIELRRIGPAEAAPHPPLRLIYNASQEEDVFILDGDYRDTDGRIYRGKVVLKPYCSLLLNRSE